MIGQKNLRVLVVDDTIVYRKAISDIIEEIPGVELAGVAHNGKIALAKIATLKPDILTLDIEMPQMNGIEVLAEIQKNNLGVGAIMVSTLTDEGSNMTMRALELGAFDFILKPQNSKNQLEGKREIRAALEPILKAFSRSRFGSSLLQRSGRIGPSAVPIKPVPGRLPARSASPVKPAVARKGKSEIVTVGISTGGPNALNQMLPRLPGDLGVPVLIVQHMPPVFTKSLAASLDKKCQLHVKEAENGESIMPNIVYIAPGGKQMKLVASTDGLHRKIKITDDPPENSCKPSVDYLFRSIADYYVGRTTAVIMTGMGSDGTSGLGVLKDKGAYTIGQDESSCIVYGMPKAPAELGYLDTVVPLGKIADEIIKSVK
ncbi:chemotaxis response regulator protein-glutamate methylesterase [Desulfopila sp. IMCC35006]|uniref:protein-glutamate methylesterase/protein-glutamine glutaminase n=1 Tax=Desulfopila sp. IMCC35006 TaxID=2569542 RepID=UPI0010AD8ED5|nr:chemotaxis response regulator protein-glutamate methylesterase [Desulfopila sp. IMCC35006]TKB25781.1 chemotaxis response regulator protein-glutamate methylesterase [Desulfopila sp. IMCC35006]